jgi:hypothetical protein
MEGSDRTGECALLTGNPSPFLRQFYDFEASAGASAAIIAVEMIAVLALGYAVFRRQEIVY